LVCFRFLIENGNTTIARLDLSGNKLFTDLSVEEIEKQSILNYSKTMSMHDRNCSSACPHWRTKTSFKFFLNLSRSECKRERKRSEALVNISMLVKKEKKE